MSASTRTNALAVALLTAACGGSPDGSRGFAREAGSPESGGHAGSGGATSESTGGREAAGGASASAGALGATGGAGGNGEDASAGSGGTGGGTVIDCRADGDGTTTLVFVNRCAASVTFRGSDIADGSLPPGAFACVDIGSATETLSAKRYWGFLGNDPGSGRHTLAEFTFNTDFNDFDWYNISHVDAHNLPMQIAPVARPDCRTLTCAADFLGDCPDVGQFRDANGAVVACVSPSRDDGNSPVAVYFETCDDAYAWSGDDQNGDDPSPVRACAGEDWDVTFCPGNGP